MRDAEKYFNRNGYVYGGVTIFENDNCSYRVCMFTNWNEAQMWLNSEKHSNQKRELLTKTETLRYGRKY